MKPLVSIITPTYGRESLLPLIYSCIQSQEWPSIQWLVDDDSPAPSPFMTALSDPRVQYHHDPVRRSVGVKRNVLVARARGEIIAHFDDDDYYAPDYLSQMLSVMSAHQADFVKLSGFFLYSGLYDQFAYWDLMVKTGLHFIWSGQPVDTVLLTEQNNQNFADNHLGYGFSYLYKKRVWDQVKFPDVTWNEDGPFITAATRSGKVVCLSDTTGLSLHILHRGNSSKSFPQFLMPQFMIQTVFPKIAPYWRLLHG